MGAEPDAQEKMVIVAIALSMFLGLDAPAFYLAYHLLPDILTS